jgi:hypothetical protein
MATNYIVDPTRFYAEGAIVDWVRTIRRLGINVDDPRTRIPTVQLRWILRGDMGMPTEPFQVWVRTKSVQGVQERLPITTQTLAFLLGHTLVSWPSGSMANVSIDVMAGSAGTIVSFAGGPLFENYNGWAQFAAGNSTVEISAPVIDGLLVPTGASVAAVRGIPSGALSAAAGWVLLETVGLPVVQSDWAGIGRHGDPQGLVAAPVDAQTAAFERLTRGGPPVGWGPLLAAGFAAPPWSAPDYGALIAEVNGELLDFLRSIIPAVPPNQLAAKRITMPVPAPQNSLGQSVAATSSDADVSPFGMTLIAASTDPFLSLVLGFGTAYPVTGTAGLARLRFDYMITAHWERGLDGASEAVDYAAIVPAPGLALPPPTPANLAAEIQGLLKPLAPDRQWRCTSRVSWDKLPSSQLFRSASFAAARAGIAPPRATEAMMDERSAGGFRPIAINRTDPAHDPIWWRNNAMDRELPIPSNPGTQTVKYGVAVQDIYGQWTAWMAVDKSMAQPDLDRVRIASARLTAVPPVSGAICPGTLEVEFFWDWSVRTPERIQFAGLLYAAAEHGSPPPSLAVPPGLARSVGGAQPIFSVTFGGGNTPSAAGATFIGLDGGGEQDVGFGPQQGSEGRRYRMTLSGFSLDFGSTGHIGLALWARGQEQIAPGRTGPWSSDPVIVAASDPRPPVVPIEHIQLGSLPDAAGQSHAHIAWTASPAAAGYFVYESDETQILKALALHEPTPDQTLDDRLTIIKDNFGAVPRGVFTRLNATPIRSTSTDVAMPRGSTAIHCYIVIGTSAGQVESDWPVDEDRLIAVAAPHIMNPAPPMLEVERFLDTAVDPPAFKVRVRIKTRPGPRVKKVELHRVRVDDAAREVDTMGPPIARLQASGGGWVVTNAVDAHGTSFIDTVQGLDDPGGSWRRVWYRATAWTDRDDTRGGLPGRSPASTAAWTVVPPAAAPVVSAIAAGGGPDPADVILEWTSTAPVRRTPLGPHVLTVRAAVPGAPRGTAPVLSLDAPLDKLPAAMPAAPVSGAWIVGSAGGTTTYRAVVRRAAITDPIRCAVRITDPIGRTGEALLDVAAGPVDPDPDLTDIAVHTVPFPPPGRTVLEFASTVPLVAPPDGPYRVRVTSFRTGPIFLPPIPITVEMAVGSVPVLPPSPFVNGLFRLAGAGPRITYVLRTSASVSRFVIRIIAPDGRFVEATQAVV